VAYSANIFENSGYTNVLPAPSKVLSCADADNDSALAAIATAATFKLLITFILFFVL
jgi:hypothetical protein